MPAAFEAALREAGILLTAEQITRVRGASKRQAIRQLLPPEQRSSADQIYDSFKNTLTRRYDGGVREIAGAGRVMATLRAAGIKVALNTGFDRDITTLLTSALGWQTVAHTIVCGDDVTNGRPAPDMIQLAMARTGIADPAQVANVGDTTLDLEAGHRAGVRWNIAVLTGAHSRHDLDRVPHTHILQSVADLPGLWATNTGHRLNTD